MNSIFIIVSNEQWEESKVTGYLAANEKENQNGLCFVGFNDLETFCNSMFEPSQFPIALEFSPESLGEELEWGEASDEKTWREATINKDRILADNVLNIYSFQPVETCSGVEFRILGED